MCWRCLVWSLGLAGTLGFGFVSCLLDFRCVCAGSVVGHVIDPWQVPTDQHLIRHPAHIQRLLLPSYSSAPLWFS